ncbi:Predicted nuclease of the RNAse H fold, HicB family [Eubacterium aggregans]|uniref:Predicted nuclease of the RNAse H fold, HicB family n=1 Tax=Eubacterium aggregans TaxID=81409 RepID=A0A1H3YTU9_9FIRM|nr:type II toxin-antitoxin system HicB family antitoxin [Eubacterium aggregans]SEA14830.1 Predicted nuclease of the RNAse H fold, HicB family [Eubacterium aggregans]
MANKSAYPAVFYPWEDGQGYTVEFPDLPGCVTQGETMADAMAMAEDAASGWIMLELEDGNPVPSPSDARAITPDPDIGTDGFVQYVVMDIAAYSRKHGKQSVKKNLTLPAWLESMATERRLNFSQVLQEALIEKLHIAK